MTRRSSLVAFVAAAAMAPVANADCLEDAARYQQLSPVLLRAIAQHESSMRPGAINRNTNGTEDIGLMQINTVHLPRLARYGITRQSLFDPCVSAYVGAWVLRDCIDRNGPTWNAVGCYNAGSPEKRLRYANLIYQVLLRTQTR